jgi:hypothetical protein
MIRKFVGFLSLLVLLGMASDTVLGCACCAEPGTYDIWTGRPDNYYSGLLDDIEFTPDAALFTTEAGFDLIKGLRSIRKEYESDAWVASPGEFRLVNSFANKTWSFQLKTKGGKAGTLNLPMPAKMLIFKVDIHDDSDKGNGPLLYKEFRFKGNVRTGTGFFKPDIAPATSYFLVFQGRGNGCDNASDFTNWRLELNGPKANYAFFGKLKADDKDAWSGLNDA